MKQLTICTLLVLLTACGQRPERKVQRIQLDQQGDVAVVVMGAENPEELRASAEKLGVEVQGHTILRLSGDAQSISQLDIQTADGIEFMLDEKVNVSVPQPGAPEQQALYLAKKDFGILDFWRTNPGADGRGVIVGVLDDGIAPNQIGFQRTSSGERKFLRKGSQSSFSTYVLTETEDGFSGQVLERRNGVTVDLNQDGKHDGFAAKVSADGNRICLDLDLDQKFSDSECRGDFHRSGDWFTLRDPSLTLIAEFNLEKKELRLFQPERDGDSHGEGVASVLAGHNHGGLKGFDGVAPGARIVDYDLSEVSHLAAEREYTIGTFLIGIDWLARNGAEVVNISYSLFYTSAQAQTFMAKAIDDLVKKQNVVISFSAGNNGPGLGSLNRRLIYPPSVLVAGAFISKELDERVHGVTGIPDEGRVVFYSSRGPGAGAAGPLMIAPLSSLTHSSPNTGYRAFNGTSSAAPALAGAATVLISAIKQAGLKVDATTVVHALRLSGKQLQNEPFIAQGFGIPQVGEALRLYRQLIAGEKFLYVTPTVNRGGLDGTSAQGIQLRSSIHTGVESYRVTLNTALSALAPADTVVNLLVPINLEYSPGISGPAQLWLSRASTMSIDVDPRVLLEKGDEGFGEIRIRSQLDGELIGIIPVTAINDRRAGTHLRRTLRVSSQEGNRLHLNVPAGVEGLRIRARVLDGERSFLSLGAYDPNYIRVKSHPFMPEYTLHTPTPGHYQVTLSMNGGTARQALVEFEIEEMGLKLMTDVIATKGGRIGIANLSSSPFLGTLVLTREAAPILNRVFNNTAEIPEAILTLAKGDYTVDLRAAGRHDLNYLYGNCSFALKNADGEFELKGTTSVRHDADEPAEYRVRCVPFDWGIERQPNLLWRMRVAPRGEERSFRVDLNANARRDLTLPDLEAGTYRVELVNPITNDRFLLGTVEAN
jgi:subtilisin family serine protease